MTNIKINLYLTESERTALTKVMKTGSKIELQGVIRSPSNILDPAIEIEADASTVAGKNYFDIPAFGRKYFITEITATGYGRCVIQGHVDVLSTYADAIRNNSGIVGRSQNKWNMYMNDNMIKCDSRPQIVTQIFKNGGYFLDEPSIALVVVG